MIFMSRKTLVLAAALIVIASGCTGQDGNVLQQILQIDVVTGGVEDISIRAEVPEFAREGRSYTWHVLATPSIDISDFRFSVYDRCGGLFTALTDDTFSEESIMANRTKTFEINYMFGETQADSCKVRFKTTYTSNMSMSQGIVVMTESEWMEREQKGTRKDIPVHAYSTVNPLRMEISFSHDQPLIEEEDVRMYIDYYDEGTGIISSLEPGDVKIEVPKNLEFITCDDYKVEGDMIILDAEKKFTNKRGTRTTCEFRTKAEQPIDSRTMFIEALYGYELNSDFTVSVLRL